MGMLTEVMRTGSSASRRRSVMPRAALLLGLLFVPHSLAAQTVAVSGEQPPAATTTTPATTPTPTPTQAPIPTAADASHAPPNERERAMLELIKNLQERVSKLEAEGVPASTPRPDGATVSNGTGAPPDTEAVTPPDAGAPAMSPARSDGRKELGTYTPNLGFQIADTEFGDLNISIYTYVRYLNQLGLDSTYTDAFGNTKGVQRRQDLQLLKLQIKFLGWILDPKMRYFLYAWTSNANQGQGAQVVLAGNLQYTFNKYVTLGGGIRSLPGTRSVEGNFPFWPNVDSRMLADEFMRPSYTSGIWATGNLADRLKYQVMVGNNMSTLGVPASRIDNGLNTLSSALIWFPTGDFEKGFSGQGWGDFEHHNKFSTRLAVHFSQSKENKESQPDSEQFENTQLRLSDGTVIFTPNLFAPGTTITDARYRMTTVDG